MTVYGMWHADFLRSSITSVRWHRPVLSIPPHSETDDVRIVYPISFLFWIPSCLSIGSVETRTAPGTFFLGCLLLFEAENRQDATQYTYTANRVLFRHRLRRSTCFHPVGVPVF